MNLPAQEWIKSSLGDVARAFTRLNPADFVRPEVTPTEEASDEDGSDD
jgi:hypothetical protein